jgi:hypothetical protein
MHLLHLDPLQHAPGLPDHAEGAACPLLRFADEMADLAGDQVVFHLKAQIADLARSMQNVQF